MARMLDTGPSASGRDFTRGTDTWDGAAPPYARTTMLSRAHEWLDRHPVTADVALALTVLAFSLSTMTGERNDATPAAIVATVLLIAPLAVRRRAPVAVFAAVMAACALELVLVDQFLAANVAALIALYTLVAYAPRNLAALGFATALAGTIPFTLRVDDFTSDSKLLTWLVLAVHVALAAMLGDRRHAQLEQRARLATLAAAEERARIARELHDIVAHSLSVVIAQADGGRYDPQSATTALTTIARTAREAQKEMRRALGLLGDAQPHASPSPARTSCPRWSSARARQAWTSHSSRRAIQDRSRPPPAWPSTASPRRR